MRVWNQTWIARVCITISISMTSLIVRKGHRYENYIVSSVGLSLARLPPSKSTCLSSGRHVRIRGFDKKLSLQYVSKEDFSVSLSAHPFHMSCNTMYTRLTSAAAFGSHGVLHSAMALYGSLFLATGLACERQSIFCSLHKKQQVVQVSPVQSLPFLGLASTPEHLPCVHPNNIDTPNSERVGNCRRLSSGRIPSPLAVLPAPDALRGDEVVHCRRR